MPRELFNSLVGMLRIVKSSPPYPAQATSGRPDVASRGGMGCNRGATHAAGSQRPHHNQVESVLVTSKVRIGFLADDVHQLARTLDNSSFVVAAPSKDASGSPVAGRSRVLES